MFGNLIQPQSFDSEVNMDIQQNQQMPAQAQYQKNLQLPQQPQPQMNGGAPLQQMTQNWGKQIGQAAMNGLAGSLGSNLGRLIASPLQKKPSMTGTSVGSVLQSGADGGTGELLNLQQ